MLGELDVDVGDEKVEGVARRVRLRNEADPVYSAPHTVAFDPLEGGMLFGAEKALMSAPVMMDRGFAAMRGMGAIVRDL